MYRPSMINKEAEQLLSQKGYVVIPLFNSSELTGLIDFYESNKPDINQKGFHSTHFFKDRAYKRKVHLFLKEVFMQHLHEHLHGYEIRFCNFMVKESGAESVMPLHTDWTYVDERQYRSLAIWCPLVDTSANNGALGVIPGSHLLPFNLRGPKITTPFHSFNEEIISQSGTLLDMKAGEAIIYDHRLMHYSPANLSGQNRVAINIVLTPKEAPIYHYSINDHPEIINKYAVDTEDFFLEYDAFGIPQLANKVEEIANPHFQFTRNDLRGFLRQEFREEAPDRQGLVSRIKQLFGVGR